MADKWNPRAVLDIDPKARQFTCVGSTQRKTRCGNPISVANIMTINALLNVVSRVDIFTTVGLQQAHGDLKDIAELCLCVRFHRKGRLNQLTDVHDKWRLAVTDHTAREREGVQEPPRVQDPAPGLAAAIPPPAPAQAPVVMQRAQQAAPAHIVQVQAPSVARQLEQHQEPGRRERQEVLLPGREAIPGRHPRTPSREPRPRSPSPYPPQIRLERPVDNYDRPVHLAPNVRDGELRNLAAAKDRAAAEFEAALAGARHGENRRVDAPQAQVGRPATPNPFWHRDLDEDEEAPLPAPAPRMRQSVVQAARPPQAAPHRRVAQPVRVEQPAVEVEYPALPPRSPPRALHQEIEPPHGVEIERLLLDAAAQHGRQARNPALQVPQPRLIRKSLDEPCYICCYRFDNPDGAVWCREGCGQNVHVGCFEEWRQTQASLGRPSNCPFCRERWVDA